MGDQKDEPTLKQHHQKFSDTAKVVIMLIAVCILLECCDITSTLIFRHSVGLGIESVRASVSSVSAEERLTAKRLDEFVEMSKKRWTFLRDDNEGKITVPALTPEEVDIETQRAKRRIPTPTPTPHHHHVKPAATVVPRKKYFWE